MNKAFVLISLLTLCACANPQTARVNRVRTDLVGLEARELTQCLPVPQDVEVEADRETLTYLWAVEGEALVAESSREYWERQREEGLEAARRGTPVTVARFPDATKRLSSPKPALPKEPELGHCALLFELQGGVVTAVEAHGRRPDGLNWDGGCLLVAQRCVATEESVQP